MKLDDPLEDAVNAHVADGSLGLVSFQILTVIGWNRPVGRAPLAEKLQNGDVELMDDKQ